MSSKKVLRESAIQCIQTIGADHVMAQTSDGTQLSTNHLFCPAGADEKSRFYVKYDKPLFVWYCHNCGNAGAVHNQWFGADQNRQHLRHSRFKPMRLGKPKDRLLRRSTMEDYIPSDGPYCKWATKTTPPDILKKHGFIQVRGKRTAIEYTAIPVCDAQFKLCGYQLRGDSGGTSKYFYRPLSKDHKHKPACFIPKVSKPRSSSSFEQWRGHCVLVEDALSAIHITEAYPMSIGIALLGVNLSNCLKFSLVSAYSNFYVWLDNDNDAVMQAEGKIRKGLEVLGATVAVLSEGCAGMSKPYDPKHRLRLTSS